MTNKNTVLVPTRNEAEFMTMPTGESSMGMYTGGRNYPTREEIAEYAYNICETRGRQNGHDIEDWLRASSHLDSTASATGGNVQGTVQRLRPKLVTVCAVLASLIPIL